MRHARQCQYAYILLAVKIFYLVRQQERAIQHAVKKKPVQVMPVAQLKAKLGIRKPCRKIFYKPRRYPVQVNKWQHTHVQLSAWRGRQPLRDADNVVSLSCDHGKLVIEYPARRSKRYYSSTAVEKLNSKLFLK